MPKECRTIEEVADPVTLVRDIQGVTYDKVGEIELANGERRRCKVLKINGGNATVQLYEVATSINLDSSKVRFLRRIMGLGVSEDASSCMFDGMGKPIDGGPDTPPEKRTDINNLSINPVVGSYPEEFIQTGVSAIDGLNTLVCGQKLPIFSASGLPHANLAIQIACQVKVYGTDEPFAVVFAAMGITFEEANFFMEGLRETGVIDRSIMLTNLTNNPAVGRIAIPCMALTAAGYLTFKEDMHVLVTLTDTTDYTDSLCEISAARKEVPGRRGYLGYMCTNLASLYKRAGHQKNKTGSITMIPILAMSEDNKTHPVPSLTSYIIGGQIILSRELYRKNVAPPIDVLSSLPHLKDKGIGENKTRADYAGTTNQLFAACARGEDAEELMMILGEATLTDMDGLYARFADESEKEYISQGYYADREIEETVEISWELLCILPRSELKCIKGKFFDLYYDAK